MSKQSEDLKKFAVANNIIDDATAEQIEKAKKPVVVIPGGSMTISHSSETLYENIAKADELYRRDGNVCQISDENGTLKLEILKPAAACSRFEDFVSFHQRKETKNGIVDSPTILSKEMAEKYLTADARKLLKPVEGLLCCPLITERNGKLHIVESGYDPITKLLITKKVALTEVPIKDAVATLKSLHQDFAFQTPGDRS